MQPINSRPFDPLAAAREAVLLAFREAGLDLATFTVEVGPESVDIAGGIWTVTRRAIKTGLLNTVVYRYAVLRYDRIAATRWEPEDVAEVEVGVPADVVTAAITLTLDIVRLKLQAAFENAADAEMGRRFHTINEEA